MTKPTLAVCAVAAAALCALAGCALPVRSDVNAALISSVSCHTFAWAGSFRGNSPLRNTIANPLNESRLRAAISANLGVQPSDSTNADCLVGYGIGARNVVEGVYYGWGWGWGGGYPWGWGYPYAYPEGIVAVDVYDARTRQPLWHASVTQDVSDLSGANADKRIRVAIDAIFTKYPQQLGGVRPRPAGGSPG